MLPSWSKRLTGTLFSRSRIGLHVGPNGIAAVRVVGRPAAPVLTAAVVQAVSPGLFRFSHREPHILQPELFLEQLAVIRDQLQMDDQRLALALPDSAGRIMLLDLEERWKNKAEACDMIRWKLKKSLALEPSDLHLDFQLVARNEEGLSTVMAAIVSKRVIQQYEQLLEQAGLYADRIMFATLALLQGFESRLAGEDDALFVSYFDQSLSIIIFADGVPSFYRSKALPGVRTGDGRLSMELNSSLAVYRQRYPERRFGNLYCFAPAEDAVEFCGLAGELCERTAQRLDPKQWLASKDGTSGAHDSLYAVAAAAGSAIGGL